MQPVDKVEDDCDRDFFMTPEEAKDYGIIDEVLISKARQQPRAAPPGPVARGLVLNGAASLPFPHLPSRPQVRIPSVARPELMIA